MSAASVAVVDKNYKKCLLCDISHCHVSHELLNV